MIRTTLVVAAALCSALITLNASAQSSSTNAGAPAAGEAARPRDATANQPSESGAQATNPKGSVTGAGQPQGAGQPKAAKAGSVKAKAKTKAQAGRKESRRTINSH